MSPFVIGIIGMAILFILMFVIRMPIGFAMALVGWVGYAIIVNFNSATALLGRVPYTTAASYDLSVIPLFVLMGFFFLYSGSSAQLFSAMHKLFGKLRGGLAMATIATSAAFAAICGSTAATVATVGSVALPEMEKRKYNSGLACGSTAAGGTLGIMIPPSVAFVIYGLITEQSIGKLFIAGIFPGLLLAALFMVTIFIQVLRRPMIAPAAPGTSFKEKLLAIKGTWDIIIVFLVVIVGIYTGILTPTEAAAVGAFVALLMALGKRRLGWQNFAASVMETVKVTGMIFIILIGAMILGHFLAISTIPMKLASLVAGLDIPPYLVMIAIMVLLLVMGCFIDAMAMVVLMVPVLYPVVLIAGFDPIWFGVVVVLLAELGLITPPVGGNVYITAGIAKDVPIFTIFRGIAPFVVAGLICAGILLAFPQIALFLPGTMR